MSPKRAEDLIFTEESKAPKTPTTPTTSPSDERATDWYRFARRIDDLLAEGHCDWARETLEGIQETVEETRRVTEGQTRAVDNIERGAERARTSRRYEGHARWRSGRS